MMDSQPPDGQFGPFITATWESSVKKRVLVLPLLCLLPLSAQSFEVGLFAGKQSFKAISYTDPANEGSFNASPSAKTLLGVRAGYALVDLGPALLQVTAGYQPNVTTTLTTTSPLYSYTAAAQDYTSSHASLGLMANFKALVAVGAGLEYRAEKASSNGVSTSFGRPWGRVNAGYAWPLPILKPFLGLEVAMPLVSKSVQNDSSNTALLQAMAPKMEVGLYGGIRF
jgi:hypothetical protein